MKIGSRKQGVGVEEFVDSEVELPGGKHATTLGFFRAIPSVDKGQVKHSGRWNQTELSSTVGLGKLFLDIQ